MLKPSGRTALATNTHVTTQTYDTYIITLFLRHEVPSRLDAKIPRKGTDGRESEAGATKNLRNDLQMETLGNHRAQYSRRSHSLLHSHHTTGLHLVRHADTEGKVIRMAQEKDQTSTRPVRKRITVGTRVLRLNHRARRASHTTVREASTPSPSN